MTVNDSFTLQRFVDAQDPLIDRVYAELRRGRKQSHWMWFVFPQISGLGHSEMAQRYAITSLAEALAYLDHPVLGPRLDRCTRLVLDIKTAPVREIFGSPDDMKFHSSMTLFAKGSALPNPFDEALQAYFGGKPDPATIARL